MVGLQCPANVNSASTTAQWTDPTRIGFPDGFTDSIFYTTNNGVPLQTSLVGTPPNQQRQAVLPPGTTTVEASAFYIGQQIASCTFTVTIPCK